MRDTDRASDVETV